mgnify:CR=1 FL=1
MSAINTKISSIKFLTKKELKKNSKKMITIKSIEETLSQIDFSAEEVPINNSEKLKKLLSSLKGNTLSKHEIELVNEIRSILEEFDENWVEYEKLYVIELMLIEQDARRFI